MKEFLRTMYRGLGCIVVAVLLIGLVRLVVTAVILTWQAWGKVI